MRRALVDSNFLNDPWLEKYLRSDKNNYVVLCDYAGIEAYKARDPVKAISESLATLSRFPDQVIVLRNTQVIRNIKPSVKGFVRRMVDEEQTRHFAEHCKAVRQAVEGDKRAISQVQKLAAEAAEFADEVASAAESIRDSVIEMSTAFTQADLNALRQPEPLPQALRQRISDQMMSLQAFAHGYEGDVERLAESRNLMNRFTFRYVLCCYILTLRWMASGNPPRKAEKIRNHVLDCGFAAYATYFDSLLSRDHEAVTTYRCARIFLSPLVSP